jgi:putative heme-binding domain-containing protein
MWLLLAWGFNPTHHAPAQNIQLDLLLPEGFEIVEYAGPTLTPDIYSMTTDPDGRIVVSSKGYIRILEDDNKDGLADRAIQFASGPEDGAMGMLWEGDRLYFTGDEGLRYYTDNDGDDRADGPSTLIRTMNTGDEHGAHAIRRGPDGWLYTIGGNETRIDASFAELDTSPIKDPVAGCLVRFTPNLAHTEIVADGFRNAYDFDFNLEGDIFTFDSDNERCQSLPWYEPTRFYQVFEGGHYGWQNPQHAYTWRKPPYFFDVVAPIVTLGRGSPCGVECYRHRQFPEKYRGGVFVQDWTFGKVFFLPLQKSGATYTTRPEVFVEPTGNLGFAVTDLVVHPRTGDLFISIGGRGTRGAVYRVRHTEGFEKLPNEPKGLTAISPRNLDWEPGLQPVLLSQAQSVDASLRMKALTRILRHIQQFESDSLEEVVRSNWDHPDRYIRWKTSEIVAMLEESTQTDLHQEIPSVTSEMTIAWGVKDSDKTKALESSGKAFVQTQDTRIRHDCIRLFQVLLGDLGESQFKGHVFAGYSARDWAVARQLIWRDGSTGASANSPANELPGYEFVDAIKKVFATGYTHLDREIARTFAMIGSEDPEILERIAKRFSPDSDPVEDIHYLFVLSRLMGPRPRWITEKTAETLLSLDRKIAERGLNRERNWERRMSEAFEALVEKDPRLTDALFNRPEFGRSEHTLYVGSSDSDRRRAAEIFWRKALHSEPFDWTPAIIDLVGTLPAENIAPRLRGLWDRWGLRRSILKVLAKKPAEEDRERFLWGLSDSDPSTNRIALEALSDLPRVFTTGDIEKIVREYRRALKTEDRKDFAGKLSAFLEEVPGAKEVSESPAPTLTVWNERLAKVDWDSGDTERGREVADRLACTVCHSGARALGPDLAGISGRFSREDLLTSILEPSRDISSQYQATVVETIVGDRLQGLVIYEANDSLILQNGPDETFQIDGERIVNRWSSEISLMPEGLFEGLTDQEIADVMKHLASL